MYVTHLYIPYTIIRHSLIVFLKRETAVNLCFDAYKSCGFGRCPSPLSLKEMPEVCGLPGYAVPSATPPAGLIGRAPFAVR